jgi:hypothetical protein
MKGWQNLLVAISMRYFISWFDIFSRNWYHWPFYILIIIIWTILIIKTRNQKTKVNLAYDMLLPLSVLFFIFGTYYYDKLYPIHVRSPAAMTPALYESYYNYVELNSTYNRISALLFFAWILGQGYNLIKYLYKKIKKS